MNLPGSARCPRPAQYVRTVQPLRIGDNPRYEKNRIAASSLRLDSLRVTGTGIILTSKSEPIWAAGQRVLS
jgi:hypothetical protein